MASKLQDVVKEAKSGVVADDDDEVTVDFSGAVDFSPVGKGKYEAILVKSTTKPTDAGEPSLRWQYEIVAAEDPENEEYIGRKLTRTLMLVGKGTGITRDTLRAHGVPIDGDSIKVNPSKVIKAAEPVLIVVNQRAGKGEYEGRTFEDITEVRELD